nr:hypothetical protein [Tanacetum cinerariifolium]
MTMSTTIEQQVALDEALVPSTRRLRIGRSNFRLPSDIQSKESTLQVIYDVLRRCLFFKAFLVTIDHIVNLETFRDMLHICPRIPGQSFDELPFEEEILEFLWFLGHSAQIKTLTDVNINKLFQPWRSFGAVINKCLTGKSFGFDSFRLSQAKILWGLYHSRNIDYAFLIWEDFMYQVEHKNQKKSNDMCYPRFTKVIIHHFMSKKLSIPRRNKVNWHYARDDIMFSTIKVVSRHQNTQQYRAMLPIELTNEEIGNSKAYKEYYACATGEAAPKPKASARRKRSGLDTSITPPTAITTPTTIGAVIPRLTATAKGKQPAKAKSSSDPSKLARTEAQQLKIVLRRSRHETHISQLGSSGIDEGTGSKPRVPDVPSDDSEEEISWNSSNDEETDTQEQDRHNNEGDEKDESDDGEEDDDDDKNGDKSDDDDEEEIPKIDVHDDTERGGDHDEESKNDEESDDEETRDEESFDPIPRTPEDRLLLPLPLLLGRGLKVSQDIEDSHVALPPIHSDGQQESSSVSSHFVSSMLNPKSDVASHPPIPPTTLPSEVLQNLPTFDSVFRFEDRLKSLEVHFSEFIQTNQFEKAVSNIPGIVQQYMNQQMTEAVKSQVKDQVLRILPRNEESVNAQLEAEVLTRSFYSSRTSYAVAADLSEMELKKILIEKMEEISPFRPSAGLDWGSKRRREGGEPESASTPSKPATRSVGRSTTGTQSRQMSASESAFAEEPVQTTCQMDEPSHLVFETGSAQTWISELAKQADSHSSFNELLDTPLDFSNFIMNRLGVDTLTPELLAGPTYELIRGSCNSLTELEYHLEEVYKATTDQLDWVNPEGQQYPHNLLQPFSLIPDNRGRRVIPFAHFINNDLEYLRGGKLSNLTVEERFAFNVSLRMFTRSIVIQRRVKDLQLGVKSYQKRLNLTKLDTYRSDLKRRKAYTAYSNPRGFIYHNKDKKNRLMQIDKLHKFSDGTLNDVRNALDDHLKGIRMQYLPQTIWRKGDKDRAAAMIQSIDKMLKTRRIMRSLERFVGG